MAVNPPQKGIFEMNNEFEKMIQSFDVAIDIAGKMSKMDYKMFITTMCFLFDAYCADHKGNDPVAMAKIVYDNVKEVNENIGAFGGVE